MSTVVGARVSEEFLVAIDEYARSNSLTRSEAVVTLLQIGFNYPLRQMLVSGYKTGMKTGIKLGTEAIRSRIGPILTAVRQLETVVEQITAQAKIDVEDD